MPNTEAPKSITPQAPAAPQASMEAPLVTETAEMVEGKVSELTPQASTKASGKSAKDDKKQTQSKRDAKLTDRELLRARLLKNAPKMKVMRSEIQKELEKEKEQLEGDIEKFRKKKQYHLLSQAIMKLRIVARQIEDLARASVDQLKDLWLKVVHRFA